MPNITKDNNRYRDIVSMIKQVNSSVNSQKSENSSRRQKTTSKSVRLQMQSDERSGDSSKKVRVVRGTVAANKAFSQIIGASELFAPSPTTRLELMQMCREASEEGDHDDDSGSKSG